MDYLKITHRFREVKAIEVVLPFNQQTKVLIVRLFDCDANFKISIWTQCFRNGGSGAYV